MKDLGWNTENITIPHLNYDLWLEKTGLDSEPANTAQTEDFDNDGLSNIEEYYHGTDPREPTLPQLELVDGTLIHQRSVLPNDLVLEYLRDDDDLTNFTPFFPPESNTTLTDQLEEAQAEIDTTPSRQFFRIRILPFDGTQ